MKEKELVVSTMRVTGKGQVYFANRFCGKKAEKVTMSFPQREGDGMRNLRGACCARDLVVDIARKYVAALLLVESEGHPVTIRAFAEKENPDLAAGTSKV